MPSAYIETSIASFYFTGRTDPMSISRQEWTRQWWSEIGAGFQLYSSPAVIVELERGTIGSLREDRISLVDEIPLLEITPEVRKVAKIYIERLLMPNDADGDALHLALVSVHEIDVLLTWNCKHLANPNKLRHISRLNTELGLMVPLVTTPLNYLSESESDGT